MKKMILLILLLTAMLPAAAQDKAPAQSIAPTVSIDKPAEGSTFDSAQPVEFEGSAMDLKEGKIPPARLIWRSDVDGYLGNGESLKKKLSAADHLITLEAADSHGSKGVASIFISALKPKAESESEKPAVPEIQTPENKAPAASLPAPIQEPAKQTHETVAKEIELEATVIRFNGICTSFYRKNQSPERGIMPTEEEMRQDVRFAKNLTGCLRGYGLYKVMEKFPEICEQEGIDCLPGIWLGKYPELNEKEIEAGLRVIDRGLTRVKAIIVGNEVLLRNDLTYDELVAAIRRIKAKTKLPVTTADIYNDWLKYPKLADEVDIIVIHIHPYWEGIAVEQAPEHVIKVYQQMQQAFPGKKIVIGETGWPSSGEANGSAVPSPKNQASFIGRFLQLARENKIEYFYFDLFDESWKVESEGKCGGGWGLLNEDGSLKPDNKFILRKDDPPTINRPANKFGVVAVFLPLNVYTEGGDEKNAFTPSGWMGDIDDISCDAGCKVNPHAGTTCTRIAYHPGTLGWGGIYWQYPINNWGESPGYKFSGAAKVTFWARGDKGGEQSIFKIGGTNDSQLPYRDSFGPLASDVIKLTTEWQQYSIDLSGADTSNVIGGFCWATTSFAKSLVIYVDDIVIGGAESDGSPALPKIEGGAGKTPLQEKPVVKKLSPSEMKDAKKCQDNLKQIMGSVQVWAIDTRASSTAKPTREQLIPEYLRVMTKCGGVEYEIPSVDGTPVCPRGLPGHSIE